MLWVRDPDTGAEYAIDASGKRNVKPAEAQALADSGFKKVTMTHIDLLAIPDAPTLPLKLQAGTILQSI